MAKRKTEKKQPEGAASSETKNTVGDDPRMATDGTLGQLVSYLLGSDSESVDEAGRWKEPGSGFLRWPPDAFAVAATLLSKSGAYVNVVTDWPPQDSIRDQETKERDVTTYAELIRIVGKNWRMHWQEETCPPEVTRRWQTIWGKRDLRLDKIRDEQPVWQRLIEICAIADEASAGMGIPPLPTRFRSKYGDTKPEPNETEYKLFSQALVLLNREDEHHTEDEHEEEASSLCERISPRKAIVLPKMSAPQSGITMRSLTHNLALLSGSEVSQVWCVAGQEGRPSEPERFVNGINLLLVPWPSKVHPNQFRPVACDLEYERLRATREETFGFFAFQSAPAVRNVSLIANMCDSAERQIGPIDGVVLPEMSISGSDFWSMLPQLDQKVRFLLAGVYEDATNGKTAQNWAQFWAHAPRLSASDPSGPKRYVTYTQYKHHRWLLDERQIRQYGLGASLSPNRRWWEYIALKKRKIHFMVLSSWLALTFLICEDLARPDPVADAIRAVGPNLVIALLQDGPQLRNRWSARYATVLADDPGCAVLTLTGLGMSELSKPPEHPTPSRVVALWKQADGYTREITLPDGADGLVLCLSRQWDHQWTADGRHDDGVTSRISLAGVHAVTVDS